MASGVFGDGGPAVRRYVPTLSSVTVTLFLFAAAAEAARASNKYDYAEDLVALARSRGVARSIFAAGLGIAETQATFSRRIEMLVQHRFVDQGVAARRWRSGLLIVGVAVALVTAAFTLAPATAEDKENSSQAAEVDQDTDQGKPNGESQAEATKDATASEAGGGATKTAKEEGAQEKKAATVRQRFRPTTTKSGETSWSAMFPAPGTRAAKGEKKEYISFIHAHRGDRWPIKLPDQMDSWAEATLVDGDDERVELKVRRREKEERITLKRQQPVTLDLDGKTFRLTYSTTTVAASSPEFVDHATIIVSYRPPAAERKKKPE